jgi:hypothetical protein
MKSIFSLSIVTLGACLFAPAARAQTSYAGGDLLVGFRQPTSNFDYVVDLGSYTNFISGGLYATGKPVDLLSGSAFTLDLSAAGASSGTFAVFGAISKSAAPSVFALFGTEMESPAGSQTAGQKPPTTFGFGTPFNSVNTMGTQFGSGADTSNGSQPNQTLGTVPGSAIQHITADSNPNVAPNNYSTFLQPTAFQFFNSPYEGSYASSGASDVLDLYEFDRGAAAATLLGELQVNDGALYFESGPVSQATLPLPEPSSLATFLAGAGVFGAFRRRRVAAH